MSRWDQGAGERRGGGGAGWLRTSQYQIKTPQRGQFVQAGNSSSFTSWPITRHFFHERTFFLCRVLVFILLETKLHWSVEVTPKERAFPSTPRPAPTPSHPLPVLAVDYALLLRLLRRLPQLEPSTTDFHLEGLRWVRHPL